MRKSPVNYEQTDSRWRNYMYSNHGDRNQTIATDGCGPTCAAMVAATIRGAKHTPITAANWSMSHGYQTYNDGTAWAFFRPYLNSLGIACEETYDKARALAAIKARKMVIAIATKGLWTGSGHFILAWDMVGDRIKIHDPNSTAASRELAARSIFLEQTRCYWITQEWEDTDMEGKEIFQRLNDYLATQPAPEWAAKELAQAKALGITDGTKPMTLIPRYQAALMAMRLGGEELYKRLNEYLAEQPAPAWAAKELAEAKEMGITDGTQPMTLIPRYQAAIMAKRAVEAAKK